MLAAELHRQQGEAVRWTAALWPLADAIVARFGAWLPKADYPVRAGAHSNTAFALALVLEYADLVDDDALADLARAKGRLWYLADADCQTWEPSGDDFLSPALAEAECMRRVLGTTEFRSWFAKFLPRAGEGAPRPCSRRPPSAIGPTARSPTSTASTSAGPGVGVASLQGLRPTIWLEPGHWTPPIAISRPAFLTSPPTTWASIGWRALPFWR